MLIPETDGPLPVIDLLNNDPRKKTGAARHPEKAARPEQPGAPKPPWLRVKAPGSALWRETSELLAGVGLTTVCQEAACPNIGSCWEQKHASFMIMGEVCTRACGFCNVATGRPSPLDPTEPGRVAQATKALGLAHVVVTSVDRDDLADGGAGHFVATIRAIRQLCPETSIEILTPDFLKKPGALETVIAAGPDVFNHNLETVPSLYVEVRPGARYFHSLRLLQQAKELNPAIFTKSGLMLGLGETRNEVMQVMDDMRVAGVDFLTLGQYLAPTRRHHPVARFASPEEFDAWRDIALAKGFAYVAASPLTRSSHHAGEDFARLQAFRNDRLKSGQE